MAATYNKFQCFATDLCNKLHDVFGTAGAGADTLKVYLTNATPNNATNTVKGDLADIASANGYTGPVSVANVGTAAAGVVTVNGTNVVISATSGDVGPFRYVVLYNFTAGTVPLISNWDYGSALTLHDSESITIKFNSGVANGTIFTLS